MSTPLTSLNARPLPQGLKELLPNPQVPWRLSSHLLQRKEFANTSDKSFSSEYPEVDVIVYITYIAAIHLTKNL